MFVSAAAAASEATILHADLDAFYASVEQRDDPSLLGRPVIVGGGVVLAASYEAKAFGVRTAMGGAHARRLCPRAVVVPPRMSAYSEASKALYALFEDTTPLRLLLPGVTVYAPVTIFVVYLSVRHGRPHLSLVVSVLGMIVTLVSALLLIPHYGASGAALASSLGYAVGAVLAWAFFERLRREKVPAAAAAVAPVA